MTEQTIPADKVRELAELARQHNSESNPYLQENLANEICNRLQAYLPDPPQPTTGLLGRWAHDGFGQVLIVSDGVLDDGTVPVLLGGADWIDPERVPLDSLTFPEQATKPEDVPAGEAWQIRDTKGNEYNAVKTSSGYYTTDRSGYTWLFCDHDGNGHWLKNKEVTLISPLTPERPGKGDEQSAPVWRIEHDHRNLRVGEYIIDIDGDDGAVTHEWRGRWDTDGEAYGAPPFAPFIVFTNKDAATLEAIEEAKRARDKEMGK